jgi:predicted nucleotidyltransferase
MGVAETLLNEIVRRVLSVARPDRIILFGSAAAGQMTKDSDLDLLVVEPVLANTREERGDSRRTGRHRISSGRHRDAD